MATFKKTLRIARRAVWYSLVTLLVVIAVLVSLLRLFLPDLTAYRDDLEHLASTFLDHTVRIETMDARLVGITPTLIFDDVYMLDKTGERELVRFEQARIGIALIDSIRSGQVIPRNFTIEGIQLAITRHEDGRFSLQGVDVQELEKTFQPRQTPGSGELSEWLFQRSRLALRHSTILWRDLKKGGNTLRFDDVNLVLRNDGQRHQLNGQVKLPERMGRQFDIAMDVRGNLLNPREMSGKIYMRGDGVQLNEWGIKPEFMGVSLNKGIADFQLWGDWKNNAISRLSGDLTAYDLSLSIPVMDKPYHLKLMGGLFDVDNSEQGWMLNVDRFQYMSERNVWPQTRFSIEHRKGNEAQAAQWRVDTEYFRLEDVASLLLQTSLPDEQQREILNTMKPAGEIRNLHFYHKRAADEILDYRFQAEFAGLSIRPWRKLPGFTGLDGKVSADNREGQLHIEPLETTLDFPHLFREPLQLTRFQSSLYWLNEKNRWRIWSRDIAADSADVELAADLLLTVPKQSTLSPYLDLQASFKNGKAEFAERYYPAGIMKPKLVEWLDRSIVDGYITHGGLVYNGRLRDFPFRDQRGQFKVEFEAKNVLFDYRQGWPPIAGIDVSAVFTGQGMEIMTRQGQLFDDTRLSPSLARIADFRNPQLLLQVDANGSLSDVARFLTESPVAPAGQAFVSRSRIDGKAHTRFEAMIPLNRRMQQQSPARYAGTTTTKGGQLALLDGRLDITQIEGQVDFDQDGVSSRELNAHLQGRPMELRLETRGVPGDGRQINILANGSIDVGQLSRTFFPSWADVLTGTTNWHGALVLETGKTSASAPLLRFDSSLEGIYSALPVPLNKSAAETSRLVTEVRFDSESQSRVSVNLADRLQARLQIAHGPSRSRLDKGELHFGSEPVRLPEERVLLITGSLADFDPAAWQALNRQHSSTGTNRPRLDIPVQIDMQHLGLTKAQDQEQEKLPRLPPRYEPPPEHLPRISGKIEQFRYNEYTLGRLEFQIRSLQKGFRLRRLRLENANLRLNASGDWWYDAGGGGHATNIDYDLSSPSMGRLLDSLGFSAIIDGGKLQSRGELHWKAPPMAFEPHLLTGKVHLQVEDGRIVKVKPGAGRLLGLFSLSALPRRLMLDFSDTFEEGLSFDSMNAEFDLRNGSAYTDNLKIDSTAADIRITGRTGLAEQDFDQYVTVTPRVGESLPVAGGLLFGTQVGAAILFLEKLLGGGIEKATARRYHVTGSWDEPVITPLETAGEKEQASTD